MSVMLMMPVSAIHPFTLKEAEGAAIAQAPELKSLEAKAHSLSQTAIAVGQLVDPKLVLGTMNVPVDTFDFTQAPMTQIQVGLKQVFPRGRSLRYRYLQKNELSVAECYKLQMMKLQVLEGVRLNWLKLYFWYQAKQIIIEQKSVFHHLVKVTESMLANNQAQQMDVVRAQLELTELDNRLLEIDQQIDTARAQLGRWIGPSLASRSNPKNTPVWLPPPTIRLLTKIIQLHPVLKTDQALILSGLTGIKLAEQQYKPGFNVGVVYGFRQGENVDGQKRADFLSAQVAVDLPIFTRNRQDRTLKASKQELVVNEENKMSHYRQLREDLKTHYAAWQQMRKSARLYQSKLIPEAKHYASATMTAYQNTQTDFPTLARAYVRELNTELAGLKASVDRDIARVYLLYLQGI